MAATDDPGELGVEGEPDAEPVLEEPLGKLPEPLVVPPLIELVPLPAAPEPELAVFSFTWPLASRQCVAAETLLPDEAPLEGDVEDWAEADSEPAAKNMVASSNAFIESSPWIAPSDPRNILK